MSERKPAARKGTCQICGAHARDLQILPVDGAIAWACLDCVRQLRECQARRYCGTVEETEPGE